MKKLMKFALVAGVVVAIGKVVAAKKAEWSGLTESEAREKLDTHIPDRVPEDKRSEVADQVVSAMRDRGALRPEEPAADETNTADQTEAPETDQPEAKDDSAAGGEQA